MKSFSKKQASIAQADLLVPFKNIFKKNNKLEHPEKKFIARAFRGSSCFWTNFFHKYVVVLYQEPFSDIHFYFPAGVETCPRCSIPWNQARCVGQKWQLIIKTRFRGEKLKECLRDKAVVG